MSGEKLYASAADKWPKAASTCRTDTPVFGLLTKAKGSNCCPTKKKKKRPKSFLRAKKRETCKATQLKWLPQRVFIPGVHGKNPSGTAANGEPWLLMKGFAWRRGGERLDRQESQLFFLLKGKEPRRSCTMVRGPYQNI